MRFQQLGPRRPARSHLHEARRLRSSPQEASGVANHLPQVLKYSQLSLDEATPRHCQSVAIAPLCELASIYC